MQDTTSDNQDNVEGMSEKMTKKILDLQESLTLQKKKR